LNLSLDQKLEDLFTINLSFGVWQGSYFYHWMFYGFITNRSCWQNMLLTLHKCI